jgi:hypothetical protein
MAQEAGIEGFCYWHYWFSHDHKLLERPFQEVLSSGKPDFPFCLGWANHSWTNKSWEAGTRQQKEMTLMQMVYNEDEYIKHFYDVLPALKDKRYITVDNKPLFLVWSPTDIPSANTFIQLWQQLAKENGLNGIHFVGIQQSIINDHIRLKDLLFKRIPNQAANIYQHILELGFDAINSRGYNRADLCCRTLWDIIYRAITIRLFKYYPISKCDQRQINRHLYSQEDTQEHVYPTIIPNWDRSPRSGKKARIYTNSTPEVFAEQVDMALDLIKNKKSEHKILFLMSWNEWAEGNYMEPDLKYGHGFLKALHSKIIQS